MLAIVLIHVQELAEVRAVDHVGVLAVNLVVQFAVAVAAIVVWEQPVYFNYGNDKKRIDTLARRYG